MTTPLTHTQMMIIRSTGKNTKPEFWQARLLEKTGTDKKKIINR
jgi:hypothetical protein